MYIARTTTVESVLYFAMFRALGTSLRPHLIKNKLSKVKKEQSEFLHIFVQRKQSPTLQIWEV